jgi:serine/threonine protein kinase
MPFDSATSLVNWLREAQLLDPTHLDQLTAAGRDEFADAQALLKELSSRGWLTRYQVHQIKNDRGNDLLLGQYRVLDRLGTGGMGEVYRARHVVMDRVVALKLINREYLDSPTAVDRFIQEARAASKLLHPNIVIAHDANQVNGTYYFAMEFIEGIDLAKLVAKSGPLPYAQACEYIRQAAVGLQHAFEKGVVHRDIKPSNLLMASTSSGPQIKILDFGLARFGSEIPGRAKQLKQSAASTTGSARLTQAGAIFGTVDYISPEQAEDASHADIRSDIFSLGCTLFYLLSKEHPFPGQDMREKIRKRKYGDPIPIRNLRDDVPPELEKVLLKMLARLPVNRYQTPADVVAALEPFAIESAKPPAVVGPTQRLRSGTARDGQSAVSRRSQTAKRPGKRRPRTLMGLIQERWDVVVWFGSAMLVFMFLAKVLTSLFSGSTEPPTIPTESRPVAPEPSTAAKASKPVGG